MKKMFENKKFLALLLSLVCCLSVGTSLAYLTSMTNPYVNVFSFSENIQARLIEPNWDAVEGMRLLPGKTVRKDPMVLNSCEVDEYVALRLTFEDVSVNDGEETRSIMSAADMKKLSSYLDIDWNTADWELFDGSLTTPAQPLLFFYTGSLAPGATTPALFTSIRVKDSDDGLTEADLRWLQGVLTDEEGNLILDEDGKPQVALEAGIARFNIFVEGSAVQADTYNQDYTTAKSDLKSLFPAT